jgi:hypothetical protein
MSLLSSLIKRLPPLRVLLGAGLALASYLVSSVWKAQIDDELKKYSAAIARASSIEDLATSLSIFQATSRFWSESIQLQRLQVAGSSQLSKGADTGGGTDDLLPSINEEAVRAIYHQEVLIQEFFSTLPEEVRSLHSNPALWGIDNYEPERFRICMITVAGQYAPLKYESELFQLYSYAANEPLLLERERLGDHPFSFTIEQIVNRLFTRIDIGHEAAANIERSKPPELASSANDTKEETIYWRERERTIRCIETGEEAILDDLSHLSQVVRRAITEHFVDPMSRTKRKIEFVETLLYVMSGFIALYGEMLSKHVPEET